VAEKAAIPNLSLRGYEVIDDAKAELEKICPGVVSCADILSIVARDAVVAAGKGPFWRVKTGRRDGRISIASEALSNLPSPFFNFAQLKASFARKGLSVKDLVVLSGGHTIGIGHCNLFSNRLYNFTGKGDMDPSLDKSYADELKTKCKTLADSTTIVGMDPGSAVTFDSHYFSNLKSHRGLFQSDAALLTDSISKNIVEKQLKENSFFDNFRNSIQKMGEIGVLTGSAGEIRKHCKMRKSETH
jgi:peroxidase